MEEHEHYFTQSVRKHWWSFPVLACKCGVTLRESFLEDK